MTVRLLLSVLVTLVLAAPALADVVPEPRRPPADPPMKLVPTKGEASCLAKMLVGPDGEPVEVPADVRVALACPTLAAVDPFGERLLYRSGNEVRVWGWGRTETLMSLFADGGGTSPALWSPDGSSVAFVSVNQARYDTSTKLFVLELEQLRLKAKHKPARKIVFVCGSTCGSSPGSDFWWEGNRRVGYRTWSEVPGDLEGTAAVRRYDLPVEPFEHGR